MRSPTVIAGIALTVLSLAFYLYTPEVLRGIHYKVSDAVYAYRVAPQASGQVAILDIDDASLAEVGQWPWYRFRVADLTRQLFDAGASVVAFDVLFAERDRSSPAVLSDALQTRYGTALTIGTPTGMASDFDAELARALTQGRTVLGCHMDQFGQALGRDGIESLPYTGVTFTVGTRDGRQSILESPWMSAPLAILADACTGLGFINTIREDDNILRRTPLIWRLGPERIYPSLALDAVRQHVGARAIKVVRDAEGVAEIALPGLRIPTEFDGMLLLNYHPHTSGQTVPDAFPVYSAADALHGRLPPRALEGKIVFVGTSAAGLGDQRATPVSAEFPGVAVQATIADNILAQDFVHEPPWMRTFDMVAILAAGLLLTLMINNRRSWLAFVLVSGFLAVAIIAAVVMLRHGKLLFVPTHVVLTVMMVYPILTVLQYWKREQSEKWVRHTFGAMVSPTVLRYLETQSDALNTGGQRVEATMFFSDLAGFSRIAEAMEPEQLSSLLNAYLTPMTEIIIASDGYVDKYEGDLIMAEWGVPFPHEFHAREACRAALVQQETLGALVPELEAQYGHRLRFRIGINTGTVTAGKMGPDSRFEYTVIGDAVNIAARLEPLNKDFGTTILIGEHTYEQVRDEFEVRLLDRVKVEGRETPLAVYELLATRDGLSASQRALRTHYEAALHQYWDGDMDRARKGLERALSLVPYDGPALRLQRQIADGVAAVSCQI